MFRFFFASYLAMCLVSLMSMIVHCITLFMILLCSRNTMIPSTTLSYPEIFESPMAVKQWIESALNSHVLDCPGCLFKLECLNSSVRYSVQWRDSDFLVCVFLNGKLKQCMVTLKELESCKYTHCWLLSCLHERSLPLALKLETMSIFSVVAKKDPSWLYYSKESYRFHLSQLSDPF